MAKFKRIDPVLKSWAKDNSLRLETEQWGHNLRRFYLSSGIEKSNGLHVSKTTVIQIEVIYFLIKIYVTCTTHPKRDTQSTKVLWTTKSKLYHSLNKALQIAKDWLGEEATRSKWNKK